MSAPINDGGPAFPVADTIHWDGHNGMTLRDHFAAQALAGFNAQPDSGYSYLWKNEKGQTRWIQAGSTPAGKEIDGWAIIKTPNQAMAEDMYAQADAMIAARERKGGAA